MKKKYNESAEDYLETILMLSKTLPVGRRHCYRIGF